MNKAIGIGRLTKNPDVRRSGDSVSARFTLALQRSYKDANGQYGADFPNCVAFGKTAEHIEKYFTQGMKMAYEGHIQTGSYTNREGQKVYTTDIVVDKVEFVESKSASAGQAQPQAQQTTPPPQYQAPQQQQQYQQAPPQNYQQMPQQQAPQQYQQPPQGQDWMNIPPGQESEMPFN